MFRYKCVCFVALLSLLANVESTRKVKVHNPRLDIVLLFDGSASMLNVSMDEVKEAMATWIGNYFTGPRANQTRFAVMSCAALEGMNQTNVAVHLDDSVKGDNPAEAIIGHVNSMTYMAGSSDNVDICAETTLNKILIPSRGDRDDAEDVALYVTDCSLYQNTDKHKKVMKELLAKLKAFLFICVMKRGYHGQYIYDNSHYEIMLSWVKDSRCIFNYTDKGSILMKLDEILPGTIEKVSDCEYKNATTECAFQVENKHCIYTLYPIISVQSNAPDRSKQCPGNVTQQCTCPNTTTAGSMTTKSAKTGLELIQLPSLVVVCPPCPATCYFLALCAIVLGIVFGSTISGCCCFLLDWK